MSNKLHILYVEDNEGDAELLNMCITRYNYSKEIVIEIAETVEEAKVLFSIDKHCAALIDWNLPDGDGIDVAHFIREISDNIPIFILSGSLTPEHLQQAEQCNPTACLEKNYNKDFTEYLYSFL